MKEEEYIDTISLQVAAQIIKHISAGLYRSPGSSIKELLSNSFDADASNVVVTFHFSYPLGELHLDKITIRDDGVGMSVKDLYYVFTHIGGSEKDTTKGSKLTEKKGRKVIGRMGIGMLSVASACRGFIVRTKKAEETREYIAKISLSFFDDTIKRSESMDKSKLGNVDLMSRYMEGYDSYTEVEISEFKPPFLEMMVPTITRSFIWNSQKNGENDSEYFEKFVEFIQYEEKLGKLAQIDRLVTDIGCMSPVEYLPDGPVRKKIIVNGEEVLIPGTNDPEYDAIKNMAKNLDFNVKIRLEVTTGQESSLIRNSFKVFKPFLYPNLRLVEKVSFDKLEPYVYILPNREDKILNDNGEYEQAIVRGYYYHQSKRISPVEYSGLLFRVFNVAMGNEFSDPMKFFVDTYMIYQQSLVEISLEDGFQEIVNLDREGLFEGSNAYRYLKNYLIHYIRGDPPPKPVQIKTETQQVEKQLRFRNFYLNVPKEGDKHMKFVRIARKFLAWVE